MKIEMSQSLDRNVRRRRGTVLVTGATGFLGTNLVWKLLEERYTVKAFGLPGSNASYLPSEVEVIYGDITIPDDLHGPMEGVDYCFHLAGRIFAN